MSKSNSDGALFLLELLRLIPRHGKITAKDLQQKLANLGYPRSERTIQRHLDTISQRFAIEQDDRAKPYGYAWAKDAKTLELAGLSAEQSLLLSLAYDELKFLLPTNISHGLNGFLKVPNAT
ncbi:hypothetical protein LP090_08675 [Moraxella bovis]|uniref:hypothetical protein n=1 Tax=Moraxella bovis TaxID=476 RepID=UPI002226A1CD|nr:hypothetical protein [Moraxella bovis]UYZ69306.1 hypothetical protein LP122_04310 [Moraxella bovis]UYZ71677.1 hypothetical protein LP089_04355 [Moraxella bovis]UYZ72407.1 hypothetical protein LP105_08305 [Moraxella bovis]UZA14975.1 hypothetical protein LP102_04305 [Moraxella bovis]UZA26666.1 hypothetical protein LP119_08535 [Moraxella bovis]